MRMTLPCHENRVALACYNATKFSKYIINLQMIYIYIWYPPPWIYLFRVFGSPTTRKCWILEGRGPIEFNIFVFTETAVFLRMPSEKREATVHRIVADDLHRDLLSPRDKHLLGQYKVGHFIHGEFFADDVDREQAMIDSAMADFQTFHIKDDYITHVNLQLQMWLTPKPKVRILPPSPESPDTPPDAEPSRSRFGLPPVFPAIGTAPKRGRIGTFNYDNKHRRIRGKTNIDAENYITGAQRDEGTNPDNGETQDAFAPEVAHQNAASSSTIPPSPPGDAMDIAEDAADEAEAKNMFD